MKHILLLFLTTLVALPLYSQIINSQDSLSTFYNDKITITATKYEIELNKMPISVNTINQNLIQTQISSNPSIGEYVRYTPGVNVAHGNRNYPAWIQLRGTGYFYGRTLYMSDEIPLNDPRLSLALHPDQLSGMEVILGPSSSLYGPNASGGAVNVRSKTGRDAPGIMIGQAIGSFGSYRPLISIGKATENWDFYTSYTVDKSAGYKNTPLETGVYLFQHNVPSYLNSVSIDDEKYTNTFFSANIGYRNDINSFGFSTGIHYFYEDKYGGRENTSVDGCRYITNGKMYFTIPEVFRSTLRVGFQEFRNFTQNTKGSVKVANKDINGRFVFVKADSNYSYVYDPAIINHADIITSNLPIDLQNDIYIFKNHILTIGGTFTREESSSKTFNADRSSILSETDYDINRYAVYFQSHSQFFDNSLSVLLGVRYDAWDFSNIYDLESGDKTPKQISKETYNFRGGIKYFVNENLQFKASAGTAFYPGSNVWLFQNISTGTTWREANPNLKPEKTRMVDCGADYTMIDNRLKLSATFYYGKIIDAINYIFDQHPTIPNVRIGRTETSDQVDIRGLELGANFDITQNLVTMCNVTLNKSEIVKSLKNTGHQLRNSPDYFGNFGFIYTNDRSVNARLFGRYSDDRYFDDENTQLDYYHMKPYLVFDGKVWKSFNMLSGNFIASLGVDNIFNKIYDAEFPWSAPGRYMEISLRYFFGL
jgi:iron complex outermembrane receptor protein